MHRPPSIVSTGSRLSVYSHASTARSTRSLGTHSRGRSLRSSRLPWYRKPLVKNAFYTDLATGAWHAAWYSIFLACWTFITAIFDVYCLEEASPGASHTGFYMISFDFVYVGNHHVRNLLMMASLISIMGSLAIFATSCFMLNALRLEKETGFQSWLYTMGIFTCWKIVHLGYGTIVNDLYFSYHIFTFFSWTIFNIISIGSLMVIYSLYLELTSISNLEDIARFKMDTMSTRGNSLYGSRPTTPHGTLSRHPVNQFGTLQSGISTQISRQPSHSEGLYAANVINQPGLQMSKKAESVYSVGNTSLYSAAGHSIKAESLYGAGIGQLRQTESLYSSTPREGPVTQFGVHLPATENVYHKPEHQENVYASLQRNQEQIYATIIN